MILKSPKNYFKQPSSRIVRICNDWNGISVSKEKDPEFYKLIDDFFRMFRIRGRKLYERESESGSMVERPITDDVLGDEYRLKECNGVWEVYKGEVSTGMKAIDRNECLKYVKSLRCL